MLARYEWVTSRGQDTVLDLRLSRSDQFRNGLWQSGFNKEWSLYMGNFLNRHVVYRHLRFRNHVGVERLRSQSDRVIGGADGSPSDAVMLEHQFQFFDLVQHF